jgi:hypothetical protein
MQGQAGNSLSEQPPYAHELRPGDSYAPLEFSISAELNQQYLFTIEDFAPAYLGASGAPAQIHPMLLLHMSARTRSPSFRLAPGMGSVFAREKVRFLRPAYVDQKLRVTWRIRDVYEKGGRLYQAMEIGIDGPEPILEREMHSVFFVEKRPGGGA